MGKSHARRQLRPMLVGVLRDPEPVPFIRAVMPETRWGEAAFAIILRGQMIDDGALAYPQ